MVSRGLLVVGVSAYPEPMDERRDDPADTSAEAEGNPLGGDETTEDQLEADNPVEEDTLRMLDPDDTPA